jgi:acetyltransferase-like isoleucine patch superfamily enzyme
MDLKKWIYRIKNINKYIYNIYDFFKITAVGDRPLANYIKVGRHTYGINSKTVVSVGLDTRLNVGNFCSFAPDIRILLHADHPTRLPSTFPFRTLLIDDPQIISHAPVRNRDALTKGDVTIGHDVWIGHSVIILSGVTIGIGAIIGAGSIVTSDIEPYAVCVGNPARMIRRRFDAQTISDLLASQWWDLPDEVLKALEAELYTTDIGAFLAKVAEAHRHQQE